jgi:hypothetical protein
MPTATATAAKPATRTRKSPVRKDVKPAEVKPTTEQLFAAAESAINALVTDADALATALINLYAVSPWEAATPKVKPAEYAASLGLRSGILPDVQRHAVIMALSVSQPKLQVKDVAALVGASEPTIARDRKELGLINANRSAAQPAKATAPAVTPAAAKTPQTTVKAVLSMTTVRAFINDLDDADMLSELADLIAERIAAVEA